MTYFTMSRNRSFFSFHFIAGLFMFSLGMFISDYLLRVSCLEKGEASVSPIFQVLIVGFLFGPFLIMGVIVLYNFLTAYLYRIDVDDSIFTIYFYNFIQKKTRVETANINEIELSKNAVSTIGTFGERTRIYTTLTIKHHKFDFDNIFGWNESDVSKLLVFLKKRGRYKRKGLLKKQK